MCALCAYLSKVTDISSLFVKPEKFWDLKTLVNCQGQPFSLQETFTNLQKINFSHIVNHLAVQTFVTYFKIHKSLMQTNVSGCKVHGIL